MKSYFPVYTLFLLLAFCSSCKGQANSDLRKYTDTIATKDSITYNGPNAITRNIIQDKKGNIWFAAFDGAFRYDGHSFVNITKDISAARFFSVLSDRNGNLWFGTIGEGVYYYDVQSSSAGKEAFKHFTTKDGLLNNEITSIYEDKAGNIWFGASGGASRYDGTALPTGQAGFQNYIIDGDSMIIDRTGKTFASRQQYEVTAIIEDKTGRFWFATRGNTFLYDPRLKVGQGKPFTVFTHDSKPFKNVRSIIEDKKGNIWLGGNDGLWRFNGSTFTNFTQKFVGHIIEDKKGNIWTSSEKGGNQGWSLSRYDAMSLSDSNPIATEIANKKAMYFGILEASDGSIWFGSTGGVNRYDSRTVTDFKTAESK
jgi:ligand-binding sensor domain-containing protein